MEALQRQRGAEQDLQRELELTTAGTVRLGWLACDECSRSQPGRARMCLALPVPAPETLPECRCPFVPSPERLEQAVPPVSGPRGCRISELAG